LEFDGVDDYVDCGNNTTLNPGNGSFTMEAWINTDEILTDTIGDIVSKFDPKNKTGFTFNIKNNVGSYGSQSNYRQVNFGMDNNKPSSSWGEKAPNYGGENYIHSLVVYDGKLYGGSDPNGRLYQWNGVDSWVLKAPKFGGETHIFALAVYNGRLYGSTHPNGKLLEWNGVDSWIERAGKLGDEIDIHSLAVYNGRLYGGTYTNGKLYEWNGVNSWVERAGQLNSETGIGCLAVYNGKLYGGTGPNGKLYEWNGDNTWIEKAGQSGSESSILSLAVYNGKLYGSTTPNAKLLEWNGVDAWIGRAPGLGVESHVYSLAVYNGKLYGTTYPNGKLIEWNNIGTWIQRSNQVESEYKIRALTIFDGKLYGGTAPNAKLYEWNTGRVVTYDHELPSGWHHLTAVKDNTDKNLKLYVDGELVATTDTFNISNYTLNNSENLLIGFGAHDYFNGIIDEVRISNIARTQEEVHRAYLAGIAIRDGQVQLGEKKLDPDIGGNWTQATEAAPWSARYTHQSVVFDDKLWVIGGHDGSTKNDTWYSADGVNWTQATANAEWSTRWGHQSIVFNNKIWVIGGRSKNDVWYSSDGINWKQATANAGWTARDAHQSVAFNNKMWVIGGYNDSNTAYYNDVWFSYDGISWTQATANAEWNVRSWHQSVVFNNKIWVIGGSHGGGKTDVWYSSDGITWTEATANAGWSARGYHKSFVFNNKIWVIGGDGNKNDVWYSTNGISWTEATANAGWSGRGSHQSIVFNNKMWIIGGINGGKKNDTWYASIPYYTNASIQSTPITLPQYHSWDTLVINKTNSSNHFINISIIDNATNRSINGFGHINASGKIDISSIDFRKHPVIRLNATFNGNGSYTPILHSWGVNWTNNRPVLGEPSGLISINRTEKLNVSIPASDYEEFTSELNFSLEYKLHSSQIWIKADGSNISLNATRFFFKYTPTRDSDVGWYDMRFRLNDSLNASTGWRYYNSSLHIKNNMPLYDGINISAPAVNRTSNVTITLLNISDKETPFDSMNINLTYRMNGTAEWNENFLSVVDMQDGEKIYLFTPDEDAIIGSYDLKVDLDDGKNVSSFFYPKNISITNNLPFFDGLDIPVNEVNRTFNISVTLINISDIETSFNIKNINLSYRRNGTYEWKSTFISPVGRRGENVQMIFTPDENATLGWYDLRVQLYDNDDGLLVNMSSNMIKVKNNLPTNIDLIPSSDEVFREDIITLNLINVLDVETSFVDMEINVLYRKNGTLQWENSQLNDTGMTKNNTIVTFTPSSSARLGQYDFKVYLNDTVENDTYFFSKLVTVKNVLPTISDNLKSLWMWENETINILLEEYGYDAENSESDLCWSLNASTIDLTLIESIEILNDTLFIKSLEKVEGNDSIEFILTDLDEGSISKYIVIEIRSIPFEVMLKSPLDQELIGNATINLSWDVKNPNNEALRFKVFMGLSEDNLSEVNETDDTWYRFESNTSKIYYWTIIPFSNTFTGRCIDDVWSFVIRLPIYNIQVDKDFDRLTIFQGNDAEFSIRLINKGNISTKVSISVSGLLSEFVTINESVFLDINQTTNLNCRIFNTSSLEIRNYDLQIIITYSNINHTFSIPVEITAIKEIHDNVESGNYVKYMIIVGIIILIILISFLAYLEKKRSERNIEKWLNKQLEAVKTKIEKLNKVEISIKKIRKTFRLLKVKKGTVKTYNEKKLLLKEINSFDKKLESFKSLATYLDDLKSLIVESEVKHISVPREISLMKVRNKLENLELGEAETLIKQYSSILQDQIELANKIKEALHSINNTIVFHTSEGVIFPPEISLETARINFSEGEYVVAMGLLNNLDRMVERNVSIYDTATYELEAIKKLRNEINEVGLAFDEDRFHKFINLYDEGKYIRFIEISYKVKNRLEELLERHEKIESRLMETKEKLREHQKEGIVFAIKSELDEAEESFIKKDFKKAEELLDRIDSEVEQTKSQYKSVRARLDEIMTLKNNNPKVGMTLFNEQIEQLNKKYASGEYAELLPLLMVLKKELMDFITWSNEFKNKFATLNNYLINAKRFIMVDDILEVLESAKTAYVDGKFTISNTTLNKCVMLIEERKSAEPVIFIDIPHEILVPQEYKQCKVFVKNKGMAHAENISISFSKDLVIVTGNKKIALIQAGKKEMLELGIKALDSGELPVELTVSYTNKYASQPVQKRGTIWVRTKGARQARVEKRKVEWEQEEPVTGAGDQRPPAPRIVTEEPDEIKSKLFITDGTIQCKICLGYIKIGTLAFHCSCNKIYHPTCASRVGECPICGVTITEEETTFSDDDIDSDESEPEIPEETAEGPDGVGEPDEAEESDWAGVSGPTIMDADTDFSISDVFLIYIDGRLIKSVSFDTSIREEVDEDILSGMLTAVKSFVADSFKEESGGLKTLQYGKMTIYLERGVTMYLAVVFRGEPHYDLRKKMRKAIIYIWEKNKVYLKAWDGGYDGLENIGTDLAESMDLGKIVWEQEASEDYDYQPPKYTGEILTEEPDESEMPLVVTTADTSTLKGCFHLYNMLLAKKGSDLRIGTESTKSEVGKARKQIIMIYHPDKWQTDKTKANFFMKKVNVAWEVLSDR